MTKPPERMIELIDTPENVQKMLGVASRVERRIFKKKKITPGHYKLWFRAKEPPNDLVRAIRRKAGLIKSKVKQKPGGPVMPLKPIQGGKHDDGDIA